MRGRQDEPKASCAIARVRQDEGQEGARRDILAQSRDSQKFVEHAIRGSRPVVENTNLTNGLKESSEYRISYVHCAPTVLEAKLNVGRIAAFASVTLA